MAAKNSPLIEEIFGTRTGTEYVIHDSPFYLWFVRPAVAILADGPETKKHLDCFAAKLGMALFREHMNEPLPLDGKVFTYWCLNVGLPSGLEAMLLSKLPISGLLKQGRFTSTGQFEYRYNTDEKGLLAALVKLLRGLTIFLIAASGEYSLGFLNTLENQPTSMMLRPGQLGDYLKD